MSIFQWGLLTESYSENTTTTKNELESLIWQKLKQPATTIQKKTKQASALKEIY